MTKTLIKLALTAGVAFTALSAKAATYDFNLTGAYDAIFSLDTDAVRPPDGFDATTFYVLDVAGTFGGVAQSAPSITFNTLAYNGGLTIELANGDFFGFFGPQLFSGSTGTPTFVPGSYALISEDVNEAPARLTISQAAAVPEPATWGLLIAGFGAIGGAMRRRPTVRATIRMA